MECKPAISLPVFSSCGDEFDPTKHWLDGLSPAHPLFENANLINKIVHAIKNELIDAVLVGCATLLKNFQDASLFSIPTLRISLEQNPSLWKAVISVQKYGVIYLGNRAEAKRLYRIYSAEKDAADQIDRFLQYNCNFHRVINYAVHRYINSSTNHVIYPGKLVPPNAISSIGHKSFAVREKDFSTITSEALLNDTSVVWDLHDFAHQATASLAPNLYGSKYFSDLQHLPSSATALIRSPGMRTAKKESKISDGLVFSELLTGIYTSEVSTQHTYASLERTLAIAIADYLLGKRSLLHPSTGKMLQLDVRISVPQLAVLVQNKAYELSASEIEQRVFTRGGPKGDERDLLDKLDTGQRLETIANSRTWMYFEVRNTIKHRAHKAAYRRVAETYLQQSHSRTSDDAKLLNAIVDAIDYKNWENDGVPNLWALVAELDCFSPHQMTSVNSAAMNLSEHGIKSESIK